MPAAQRFLDGALLDRLGRTKFVGVFWRRMGFCHCPRPLDLPPALPTYRRGFVYGSSLIISLQGDAASEDATAILGRTRGFKQAGFG